MVELAIILLIIFLITFIVLFSKSKSKADKYKLYYQDLTNKHQTLIKSYEEEKQLLKENYQKEILSCEEEKQLLKENYQKAILSFEKEKQLLKENYQKEIKSLKNTNEYFRDEVLSLIENSGDEISDKSNLNAIGALRLLTERNKFLLNTNSNLKAIPYMAAIMADYETVGLKELANKLDWGASQERAKKVTSLIELRRQTTEMLKAYKQAQYQLNYLLELYPGLQDIIECEFGELPQINTNEIPEHDFAKDYLSKEEYMKLSETERNQLALDRYVASHSKTNWQIGRDYELYVGYRYSQKGYKVDYVGSLKKLEDMGRDLICKKAETILIIQCKYWSSVKTIHEKHIMQLYGTTISYCIEKSINPDNVQPVFVTNIALSPVAKKVADYLNIECVENFKCGEYPRIKCNIGHSEFGTEKIYHLPFDQQYDNVVIDKPGEFFAMTVKEAERAGFRRAFRWHSS